MDRAEYVRLLHDASIKDYLNLFLSVKRNPNEKDALSNTITQVTGKGTTTLVISAENTSQIYCRQDLRQWLTLSPSIWSAQDPQGKCLCVLYYLRISHLFRETTIRLLDLNCTRYHIHSFYVFHTLLLNNN